MQISPRQLDSQLEQHISGILLTAFAACSSSDAVDSFLQDLLTDTERTVVAKRLAIALMLQRDYGYNQICDALKVSPPTVAKVKQWLHQRGEGFRQVLVDIHDKPDLRGFWERVEASLA